MTDGRLPDGMGTMLADQAATTGVPAIIVTGYAFKLHEDEPSIDLSRYNILLKRLRPSELLEAVAEALGAREKEFTAGSPV